MPAADVFVMPSTFPEAFGMVAAEAAACGVPPVSADHSGMREVSRQLADAVGPELAPLLSFDGRAPARSRRSPSGSTAGSRSSPPSASAVGEALGGARRASSGAGSSVAEGVIAASRGDLDALPRCVGPTEAPPTE